MTLAGAEGSPDRDSMLSGLVTEAAAPGEEINEHIYNYATPTYHCGQDPGRQGGTFHGALSMACF